MSGLHDDMQPLATTHPLGPAQTAIRYCLAVLPDFCAWARGAYGDLYAPGFFDDLRATEADLTESHNAIGLLISEAVTRG